MAAIIDEKEQKIREALLAYMSASDIPEEKRQEVNEWISEIFMHKIKNNSYDELFINEFNEECKYHNFSIDVRLPMDSPLRKYMDLEVINLSFSEEGTALCGDDKNDHSLVDLGTFGITEEAEKVVYELFDSLVEKIRNRTPEKIKEDILNDIKENAINIRRFNKWHDFSFYRPIEKDKNTLTATYYDTTLERTMELDIIGVEKCGEFYLERDEVIFAVDGKPLDFTNEERKEYMEHMSPFGEFTDGLWELRYPYMEEIENDKDSVFNKTIANIVDRHCKSNNDIIKGDGNSDAKEFKFRFTKEDIQEFNNISEYFPNNVPQLPPYDFGELCVWLYENGEINFDIFCEGSYGHCHYSATNEEEKYRYCHLDQLAEIIQNKEMEKEREI